MNHPLVQRSPRRPFPAVDTLTKPFWTAAKNGILAIQQCDDCNSYFHPPVVQCAQCCGSALHFRPVSGKGTVVAYTIMHEPRVSGFEGTTPYTCVLVELDEQPGLILASNLVGEDRCEPRHGMRAQVVFEAISEDIALPQFCGLNADRTTK